MSHGFLIDAGERTITIVDYEAGMSFNHWMPGGIAIGATFETGDVLFVDDEGLLRKPEAAFRLKRRVDGQPFMGRFALLVGPEDVDGDAPRPVMTTLALEGEIEWLSVHQAMEWFHTRASEAAVTVTVGGESTVLNTWADMIKHMEGE